MGRSHQCYPHKIITGRRDRIKTLRKGGGLSGFTKRTESEYDPFGAAHSSTSISSTLGMAVAKKLSNNKNNVIAVIGDGGYQMTIQELGTIFQTRTAVKILVLNNDYLGMVRQWQQLFFDKRYASTEMTNPDFVTIAKGYNINSNRVNERKDLDNAVKLMVESNEPQFLEVCVEKEDNVFPMIPSGASVSDIRLK